MRNCYICVHIKCVDFMLIQMTRDTEYTLTESHRQPNCATPTSFMRREVKLKNLMTHSRANRNKSFPTAATNTHYIPLLAPHCCCCFWCSRVKFQVGKHQHLKSHKNRHKFSFFLSHQRQNNFNFSLLSQVVISQASECSMKERKLCSMNMRI
jgi:hypothetical protein